jgi:hypothetical protein
MERLSLGSFTLLPSYMVMKAVPELEEFESPMEALIFFQKNVFWWIGDMILEGEKKYGDYIWQCVPPGVSQEMLDRCVAVAKAYPRTERNHNLSWTHHMVVSNKRNRQKLLKEAEEQGWSSGELRQRAGRSRSSNYEDDSFAGSAE